MSKETITDCRNCGKAIKLIEGERFNYYKHVETDRIACYPPTAIGYSEATPIGFSPPNHSEQK